MAVQHRKQLSRLNIPSPSPFDAPMIHSAALTQTNPMAFYTPALATAMQATFPPQFQVAPSLQTPGHHPFTAAQPGTPNRNRHRQNASVANLFGALQMPPPSPHPNPFMSFPSGHQHQMSVSTPHHVLKSRRNASVSIGGPPKAVLGGPQRKVTPLPSILPEDTTPVAEVKVSIKKPTVHLPDETGPVVYDGNTYSTPPWSRNPLAGEIDTSLPSPPDISSRVVYPTKTVPFSPEANIEVFLPDHDAWDEYRRYILDEGGSQIHSRSEGGQSLLMPLSPGEPISSPADPALLTFKLNKLRMSQTNLAPASPSIRELSNHEPSRSNSAGSSRPVSRRDYVRGFGLDITEEEGDIEESAFGFRNALVSPHGEDSEAALVQSLLDDDDEAITAAPTRIHSRHISQAGGPSIERNEGEWERSLNADIVRPSESAGGSQQGEAELIEDAKSLGEYSNPSDEDYGMQKQIQSLNAAQPAESNFGVSPFPTTLAYSDYVLPASQGTLDEVISNPSDEEATDGMVGEHITHSRSQSGTTGLSATFLPNPHQFAFASRPSLSGLGRDQLNPFARPFSFGGSRADSEFVNPLTAEEHQARSAGRSLNAFAQEFQPTTYQSRSTVPSMESRQHEHSLSAENVAPLARPDVQLQASVQISSQRENEAKKNQSEGTPPDWMTRLNVTAQPFVPSKFVKDISLSSMFEDTASPSLSTTVLPPVPHEQGTVSLFSMDLADTKSQDINSKHPIPTQTQRTPSFTSIRQPSGEHPPPSGYEREPPHGRNQSLDDFHVTAIARKAPSMHAPDSSFSDEFGVASSPKEVSVHDAYSVGAPESPARGFLAVLEQYEQRLEDLLDDKMELLRRDLLESMLPRATNYATGTELSASPLGAHRSISADTREAGRDAELLLTPVNGSPLKGSIVASFDATVRALLEQHLTSIHAMSTHSIGRLDDVEKSLKDSIASEMENLGKIIGSRMRNLSEMMDTSRFTEQLLLAVRPQILELISLAPDRKETVSLIVEELDPLFKAIRDNAPVVREHNIAALVTEALGQANSAFVKGISQQVASELTPIVQSQYNGELVSRQLSGITLLQEKAVTELHASIEGASGLGMARISELLLALSSQELILGSLSDELAKLRMDVDPASLGAQVTLLQDVLLRCLSSVLAITPQLNSISEGQSILNASLSQLLHMRSEDILRMEPLLESVVASSNESKNSCNRLPSLEDLKALFSENLTMQSLKSEMDTLRTENTRLTNERDHLTRQAGVREDQCRQLEKELTVTQAGSSFKETQFKALSVRNEEVVLKLDKALERICDLEATLRASEERSHELEVAKHELLVQSSQWKAKHETLQLQADWLQKDKQSRERELKQLSAERDRFLSQQSHWDDVRRTAERVELIAESIRSSETRDREELQILRDRIKITEGENLALQKRIREQDTKLANVERASMTARQNLAQAQQRAADWEKRAKDFESALEKTGSTISQLEEARLQLEAEVLATQAQTETRESESQLCVAQLRDQVQELTNELMKTRGELTEAKKAHVNAWRSQVPKESSQTHQNGPIIERSSTPTPRVPLPQVRHSSDKTEIQNTSTWDSMHAPPRRQPRHIYQGIDRATSASPTPSMASNAPTLQEDGWWS